VLAFSSNNSKLRMNNVMLGDDVRGFSKIASNQVMIHQKIQEFAEKK
jgi:argininosuccinate synthase